MPELLVIHHSPTGSTERLLKAAVRGARHPELQDVTVTAAQELGATLAAHLTGA